MILGGIATGLVLSYITRAHVPVLSQVVKAAVETRLTELAGDAGFLYLMFLAGSSIRNDVITMPVTSAVAVGGFIVPFCLTYVVTRLLLRMSITASIVASIALSVTAEAPTVAAFDDVGIRRGRASSVVLGAGMVDDVLGLVGFVVFALCYHLHITMASLVLPLAAILLFFGGYALRETHEAAIEKLSRFASVLVYVFFILLGYHVSFQPMLSDKTVALTLLLLLAVAVVGKVGGVQMALRLTESRHDLEKRDYDTIAWGMNSRGIIGMAIILLALKEKLIDRTLYTTLLLISAVTIAMLPVVLGRRHAESE
jgi:Kef-type K+ transport system membrane component KefB